MSKEVRTQEQVKIWKLNLNPMTANTERSNLVALAYSKESMVTWLKEQMAPEPYTDGNWFRVFKKESSLENYNLPGIFSSTDKFDESKLYNNPYGHGISSEWTTEEFIQHYIADAQASFGFTFVPTLIEVDK